MMQACDQLSVNYGIIGKGSDSGKPGLYDQCNAGVVGLKLHEDFGCTPATIDNCLRLLAPVPFYLHHGPRTDTCYLLQCL